jgi:uncharacterized membrane protein YfcA
MVLVAAAATFAAASVQSATGFGFALLLGPVLFAMLDPREALTALLLLGLVLNLLVLLEGDARDRVRWREISPLLVAALPGLALGLVVLLLLPKPGLQVAVGVAVLAAVALQARRRPVAPTGASLAPACAVGLASGALTTSTSVSGPPLVLWLRARGLDPVEFRASLAAAFLGLNLAGAAVLLVAGGAAAAAPGGVLLTLLAFVAAGHLAGRRAFRRLDRGTLSKAVLALAALAGAASVAAGLSGV